MSNNADSEKAKKSAMSKIETINSVEGFDPRPLVLEFGDLNDGKKRYRLPVMAQIAWFRLKYPEGRIAVTVKPGKDYFIGEAKIYANYKDSSDCYLSEGSASRGYLADKPTVSPREWAQTAAIGIALRNAGFGLQFDVAGESFDNNELNELSFENVQEAPEPVVAEIKSASTAPVQQASDTSDEYDEQYDEPSETTPEAHKQPELSPLEKAKAAMCPIARYKDKTLGEMICLDPSALAYIAKSGAKYGEEVAGYAILICEYAKQQASA